jgi:hypothetical protein
VTHGYPNCQVGSALYVLIARELCDDAEPEAALAGAVSRLQTVYAEQPSHRFWKSSWHIGPA